MIDRGIVSATDRAGAAARAVRLRTGEGVRVRPIRADDERRLARLFGRLSPHTRYHRFFSIREFRPDEIRAVATLEGDRRLALVAEVDAAADVELVGLAQSGPSEEDGVADLALLVEDAWQGRGLGSILLEAILDAAERRGIHRFSADMLSDNRRILHLAARYTDVTRRSVSHGVTSLVFQRRAEGSLSSPASVPRAS